MKKLLLVALLGSAFPFISNAQNIRLNLYGSYVFDNSFNSYYTSTNYFQGTIQGGFLWGGGLEFMLRETYSIDLSYQRLDTHTPLTYYDLGPKSGNFKTSMNYIMLGGAHYLKTASKFEPYGGAQLGVCIIDATNPNNNTKHNATKFAWGLRLGSNIWASDRVGLKLQAQLLSAVQGAGGGVYFGTGGGGVGVSTYSTILQFSLGGGLTFRLGGK